MGLDSLALVLSVLLNAGAAIGLVFKVRDRVIHPIERKLDVIHDSVEKVIDEHEKLAERTDYMEMYLTRVHRRYTPFRRRL